MQSSGLMVMLHSIKPQNPFFSSQHGSFKWVCAFYYWLMVKLTAVVRILAGICGFQEIVTALQSNIETLSYPHLRLFSSLT